MQFVKVGLLWNATKKDSKGRPFMNGKVDRDIELLRGQKIYVFQNSIKPGSKAPVANLIVKIDEEGDVPYEPSAEVTQVAPESKPVNPLPDEDDCPF